MRGEAGHPRETGNFGFLDLLGANPEGLFLPIFRIGSAETNGVDPVMTVEMRSTDQHIIERYTDQPARLPLDLRRRIEQRCGGLPVQLYALADLDVAMNLSRTWVTLGPRHVVVASQPSGHPE